MINKIMTKAEVIKAIDRTLKEVSEFENMIWNEAIEKAACVAMGNGEGCCHDIGEEIRKLKK